MTTSRTLPHNCTSMSEVRHGVDRLDEQIVSLLAERFRYMEAAARIKPDREAVRDEWRKADVLAKVREVSQAERGPAYIIADLYENLVEASIAYELRKFDQSRS